MALFGLKEKYKHYDSVAKRKKATKQNAKKYSAQEQVSYAKGYRDAVNDSRRAYKYRNSTAKERQAYKEKRKRKYDEYKKSREKEQNKSIFDYTEWFDFDENGHIKGTWIDGRFEPD